MSILRTRQIHPNDGLVYFEFRIVDWAPVGWDVKRRRKLSVCVLDAATVETSACSEYESIVITGSGEDGSAHAGELEGGHQREPLTSDEVFEGGGSYSGYMMGGDQSIEGPLIPTVVG